MSPANISRLAKSSLPRGLCGCNDTNNSNEFVQKENTKVVKVTRLGKKRLYIL